MPLLLPELNGQEFLIGRIFSDQISILGRKFLPFGSPVTDGAVDGIPDLDWLPNVSGHLDGDPTRPFSERLNDGLKHALAFAQDFLNNWIGNILNTDLGLDRMIVTGCGTCG